MFRLVLVSYLLAAAQGGSLSLVRRQLVDRNIFPISKIVGGSATTIDQVPWQVTLETGGSPICGGSIISANYILTAAHCTYGLSASSITVRTGSNLHESDGIVTKVSSIAQNPEFSESADYDVAVLKLASALTLDANQAAVPLRNAEASAGEIAELSGWGRISSGGRFPSNLQSVKIPIVARKSCNASYDGDITPRMICAGEAGKDSCEGDSGGALTINGAQVGIVSWGYVCADDAYPGVYSNVAALKSYINENSNNEAKWVE